MTDTREKRREKGLYWDRAWKLVEGCTKVSPGCDNCWSEAETLMRACHPNDKIRARAREVIYPGCVDEFSGEITIRQDNLELPLTIKKPTVLAIWNDLYHEDVPDSFRDRAYAVMSLCPQHTFLVLTKRAERMVEYWCSLRGEAIESHANYLLNDGKGVETDNWNVPAGNIYHGVTACNQQEAEEKIPHLLKVPGKRFLSIEPMLGAINLTKIPVNGAARNVDFTNCLTGDTLSEYSCRANCNVIGGANIHQVILGGESGPGARPMNPNWARGVRDQCRADGVAFSFKQHGMWEEIRFADIKRGDICGAMDHYGNIISPDDRFDPVLGDVLMRKTTKKKAGRTFDGQLHAALVWDK